MADLLGSKLRLMEMVIRTPTVRSNEPNWRHWFGGAVLATVGNT